MICDFTKPEEILRAFMIEMHEWETESFELIDFHRYGNLDEETREKRRKMISEKLDAIFDKYCTPKKRAQGRQNSLGISSPPTYDLSKEFFAETVEESARRVLIYTEEIYLSRIKKRCYVLLKKGDKWLLDGKKQFFETEEKWAQDYL